MTISVENVCKTFFYDKEKRPAIRDLTLHVPAGGRVSIIGRTGCGKSTLLKLLGGLIAPDQGCIHIDGNDPEHFREKFGLGFMFQQPFLLSWKSVIDNVLLPFSVSDRYRKKYSRDDAYSFAWELLDLVGLTEVGHSGISALSGGMKQRVALARCLFTRPKLLLLDEPFSSLDDLTKEELWFEVYNILESSNVTAIAVTHSIREAVFFGDIVYRMEGPPGNLVRAHKIDRAGKDDPRYIRSQKFFALCSSVSEA